jgi:ABC-type phosphate transport system substrate-binding protein
MKKIRRIGLGVAAIAALLLTQASPAHAEGVGQPADAVGVGSDTIMFAANFMADGDAAGDLGFNAGSLSRRMISMDPTGDANGRLTTLSPAASVVLRAGHTPVVRPNGSGAGINFMNQSDKVAPYQVSFVRSSALPSTQQQSDAVTAGFGGLHCYQLADDGLQMAVSNLVATNAPSQGLTVAQLVQLYSATGTIRTWGDVPGYTGPAPTATIKAVIPQSSAGTFSFFNAQLTAANGGTPITYRTDANLFTSEEHDPTPIQSDPNAIGPFSVARKTLLDSGYLGASFVNTVNLQSTTSTGNANVFAVTRPVFFIVRQNSVTDHTGADGLPFPWRGSGAAGQNWVEALFGPAGTPAGSPGGFLARSTLASPLIAAAGFTYHYVDAGLCHS